MDRQQEITILRLWREWCMVWPKHYGRGSLQVGALGYDPIFDVIPCQAYIDFYHEVTRKHPRLGHMSIFEVMDTALNQIRAPETLIAEDVTADAVAAATTDQDHESLPLPVVTVELEEVARPTTAAPTATSKPVKRPTKPNLKVAKSA